MLENLFAFCIINSEICFSVGSSVGGKVCERADVCAFFFAVAVYITVVPTDRNASVGITEREAARTGKRDVIVCYFAEFNGETDFLISERALRCKRIECKSVALLARIHNVISVFVGSELFAALIKLADRGIDGLLGCFNRYFNGFSKFFSAVSDFCGNVGLADLKPCDNAADNRDYVVFRRSIFESVFACRNRITADFKGRSEIARTELFDFQSLKFDCRTICGLFVYGNVKLCFFAVSRSDNLCASRLQAYDFVARNVKHFGIAYGVFDSGTVVGGSIDFGFNPFVDGNRFVFKRNYGFLFLSPFEASDNGVVESAERNVVSFAYIKKENILGVRLKRFDIIRPVAVNTGGVFNLFLIIVEKKIAACVENLPIAVAVRRVMRGLHSAAVRLALIVVIPEQPYEIARGGIVGIFRIFITEVVMISGYRGIYNRGRQRAERIEFNFDFQKLITHIEHCLCVVESYPTKSVFVGGFGFIYNVFSVFVGSNRFAVLIDSGLFHKEYRDSERVNVFALSNFTVEKLLSLNAEICFCESDVAVLVCRISLTVDF